MENKPLDNHEDDDDVELDKDGKSKKSKKVSRYIPLSGAVEAKPATEDTEKPRLSFSDQFLKRMGVKTGEDEKPREKSDDTSANDKETATDDTKVEQPTNELAETSNELRQDGDTTEQVTQHTDAETDDLDAEPATAALIAEKNVDTSWDQEGEFGEDGEITLHRTPPAEATPPPTAEIGEPAPEPPVDEELLETGLGAEGPPEPPEPPETPPGGAAEYEDEPEPDPAIGMVSVADRGHSGPWYDAAAADRASRDTHERDSNDTAYYAEKHGVRRGLTAGLLFGWAFGRRGKKRQAEAFKKEVSKKDVQITELKKNQIASDERQAALRREQEALRSEVQQTDTKRPVVAENAPRKPLTQQEILTQASPATERLPVLAEAPKNSITDTAQKIAEFVPLETTIKSLRPEQTFLSSTEQRLSAAEKGTSVVERRAVAQEVPPENREITEDMYQVAKSSRVETSAWHRIEIDAKTGKPVENPEVAYGEEFKREQAREIWRDNKTKGQGTVAAGGVSAGQLGGLAAASSGIASAGTTVDHNVHNTYGVAPYVAPNPVHDIDAGNDLLRYASSPVTWIIAIGIVVLLFLVGALK